MTRGDDTAAAHIPGQPSTQDSPDDDLDSDHLPPDRLDSAHPGRLDPDLDAIGDADVDANLDADVGEDGDADLDVDGDADVGGDRPAGTAAHEVRHAIAELDERAKEILAFERRWWRQAGSKEQAIRDTFGLSATRYYQLLNALLDDPAALRHEPVVVQRLRRLRASRIRARGSDRRQ